jgi:RHS repeat-associated protein
LPCPLSQPTLTVNSATNRITNTGYTYDNAGNMTSDSANTYTFDGANRLTRINGTGPAYIYFGPQRIKKVAGWQLLATIVGNTTTYHHPDHLSNRAESNSSGTRTRTFGHLPFGDLWYETGTADKWKFTGYERDSGTGETGLDYANFRYYASGLAKFLSPDPLAGKIKMPASLNRYSYALNDPVSLFDPTGLQVVCARWEHSDDGGVTWDPVTPWDCQGSDGDGDGSGGGGHGGDNGGGGGGGGGNGGATKKQPPCNLTLNLIFGSPVTAEEKANAKATLNTLFGANINLIFMDGSSK